MSDALDLGIESLEALDAPAFKDFVAGIGVGLAIVGLAVAAAT
jgi:hypothetical protein